MSYASGFYTYRDAYKNTRLPFGRWVYASVWAANQMAQFMRFTNIEDGSGHLDYRRRAHGDIVTLNWIMPGQAITAGRDPHIVEARSSLRLASQNVQIPSHLRDNYNNNQFIAPTGGPFRPQPDPLAGKLLQVLNDHARQAWETAITGKYIDTVSFASGGGLTATFVTGVISPGPYNDGIGRGNGVLRFIKATSKASYKAPGDSDYGPELVVATTDLVTLRSGNADSSITFTVGTIPASDAHSELVFTSSSNKPDGLMSLMEPSQKIRFTVPTAVDFKHLDQLLARLHPAYRSSVMTCFVMHTEQFIALSSLARALGGTTLLTKSFGEMITDVPPGLEPFGLIELPVYRGHPILIDDTIPTESIGGRATRPIFAVCLDPMVSEGQGVDYGAFVGAVRGSPIGPVLRAHGMGWKVSYLGEDQGSANDLARVTLELCWGLGSSGAAAQTDGFYDP